MQVRTSRETVKLRYNMEKRDTVRMIREFVSKIIVSTTAVPIMDLAIFKKRLFRKYYRISEKFQSEGDRTDEKKG